ncbi:MAG: calcium/sodium antiporter [Rhodobacteraceae bacterium]|nr:calcium/sodium antiporter [Paracoccaceae bacterium]
MDLFFALLGLTILLLAGDALVRGAVNLALRLGIPALIVSLTIVSLGTSAPELFISVGAVLDGAPGIALGNVVGSNVANVLLVLGVPALISGIDSHHCDTGRAYLFMMATSVWFIGLCFLGPLIWVHGVLLLGVLAAVLIDQGRMARAHLRGNREVLHDVEGADPTMPWPRIAIYLGLGLVGLPVGAELLVTAAVNIATAMGVSDTVIGLTLVAVGTSLPELATTAMAAIRRHAEVALGNVIGSNMFNLLAIVGVASFFGEIPVAPSFLRFDLWVMLGASALLAPFVLRQVSISRVMGAALAALYLAYVLVVLL